MDSQSYSAAGEDEHVEPAVVYQEEGGVYILFYIIILYLFFGVYIIIINGSCSLCSLSQSRGKITCCPNKNNTSGQTTLHNTHYFVEQFMSHVQCM